MKEIISYYWCNIRIFFIKILCYYLALLTWIAAIIMCVSVVLIPLFVYLKEETDWFRRPFYEAYWLGGKYENWANTKWLNKYYYKREGD